MFLKNPHLFVKNRFKTEIMFDLSITISFDSYTDRLWNCSHCCVYFCRIEFPAYKNLYLPPAARTPSPCSWHQWSISFTYSWTVYVPHTLPHTRASYADGFDPIGSLEHFSSVCVYLCPFQCLCSELLSVPNEI